MSIMTDTEYLQRIQYKLTLFKKVKQDVYNFRCPLCGDSKTHENKARGYIFKDPKRSMLVFKCHRCNESMGFSFFLRKMDALVHKDYTMAYMRQNQHKKKQQKPADETYVNKNKKRLLKFSAPKDGYLAQLKVLSSLDDKHPAKQYMINRKIPENTFSKMYWTDDFMGYVNSIVPDKFKKPFKEGRLCTVMKNKEGKVFGVQGRSIDADTKAQYKYITIIFDYSESKIFGQSDVDYSKPVTVVEGPYDSLFLDNCLAAMGSSLDAVEGDIYILDNEPRNVQIVKIMLRLLKRNKAVVILDRKYAGMDINDLVLSGMSHSEIKTLIKNSTYTGLPGIMKLNSWKLCK